MAIILKYAHPMAEAFRGCGKLLVHDFRLLLLLPGHEQYSHKKWKQNGSLLPRYANSLIVVHNGGELQTVQFTNNAFIICLHQIRALCRVPLSVFHRRSVQTKRSFNYFALHRRLYMYQVWKWKSCVTT